MGGLFTAELAIYIILVIPIFFILFRHLWTGLIGWVYLIAFCTLRIVGGAMSLSSHPSDASAIISSVAISPLLLATTGILHEARVYRADRKLRAKTEWIYVLIYHILVGSGIGIVASGASALEKTDSTPAQVSSNKTLVTVGMAILTVCWILTVIWAAVSLLPSQQYRKGLRYRTGSLLLYAVLIALPFLGIRVIYELIALSTMKSYLNPINGSLTIRVLLSFLPELIMTLVFIAFGLPTRHQSLPRER